MSIKITFRFHIRYFVLTFTTVTVINEENNLTHSPLSVRKYPREKKEQLLYNTTQHLYNSKFFYLAGIPLEIKKKTTQFRNARDVDVFIYDAQRNVIAFRACSFKHFGERRCLINGRCSEALTVSFFRVDKATLLRLS